MSLKLSHKKITMIAVIVIASLIISMSGAYALDNASNPMKGDLEKAIIAEEVTVISIDNSTITVVRGAGDEMRLFAKGTWIIVSDKVEALPWIEAKSYVKSGEAKAIILTRRTGNETGGILLGLKQDEITIFRPILAKACIKRHKHASIYLSIRGKVEKIGENYMILKIGDQKILALARGDWIKAGAGEASWKDVSNEFNQGDQVRLFYHNLITMNNLFAENLGIRGFIWGYSGAIIDLTSGATLSRK